VSSDPERLFTPAEREETAERIAGLLEEDKRIVAAVIVGSLARKPDRWSDVDLSAVVSDEADTEAVAADWVERLYEALPVVHHFETVFGETLVRGLLLECLLEVDLAFTPASHFEVWGPARLVFSRSNDVRAAVSAPVAWRPEAPDWQAQAGFAWHDVLHACTAVRRGRLWQATWYLERTRNRTLTLGSERRGFYAGFHDYVDDLPAEELEPLQASLVGSLAAEALLPAIEAATRAFLAELRRGDASLADRLEAPLLGFVRLTGS
jgi:predicted nucleotidyltransferase